jgi:MarR family transcriptional regulator, organic hydroperoxide resistance regulator
MTALDLGRLLYLVSRAHHNLASRTFPQLRLHRGQVGVLFQLEEHDCLNQTVLAEQMEISPATLTNLLNRMETAGFILRRHDQSDSRLSRVCLTEAGNSILSEARKLANEMDLKSFAGFSTEELEKMHEFLQRIHANLSN